MNHYCFIRKVWMWGLSGENVDQNKSTNMFLRKTSYSRLSNGELEIWACETECKNTFDLSYLYDKLECEIFLEKMLIKIDQLTLCPRKISHSRFSNGEIEIWGGEKYIGFELNFYPHWLMEWSCAQFSIRQCGFRGHSGEHCGWIKSTIMFSEITMLER